MIPKSLRLKKKLTSSPQLKSWSLVHLRKNKIPIILKNRLKSKRLRNRVSLPKLSQNLFGKRRDSHLKYDVAIPKRLITQMAYAKDATKNDSTF